LSTEARGIQGDTGQRSRPTIGLLIADLLSAYHTEVWRGIVDAAQHHDANLLTFTGGVLGPSSVTGYRGVIYDCVSETNVDGLVVMSGALSSFVGLETLQTFCEERYLSLPIVSLGGKLEGIPSIAVDNAQGLREALAHLIKDHGHRRIACIRGPEASEDAQQRYHTYISVLAEYDIPLDPSLVVPCDFLRPSGKAAITMLLDERMLRPQADFEAIVAANDDVAFGVMEVLQARGIRIPHDVAVIGFDDVETASLVTPPLTTVQQPLYEKGKKAVEMLLKLVSGEKVSGQVTLPTKAIIRQSCGCLARAVLQAKVGPVGKTDQPSKMALPILRERIISDTTRIEGTSSTDPLSEQAEELLNALLDELREETPGAFLSTLDKVLTQTTIAGRDVSIWQEALSIMRRHLRPHISDSKTLSQAEDLWQQARVMVGRAEQRFQARRRLQAERQTIALNRIRDTLTTTLDMPFPADTLAEGLAQFGIPGCYLSLYAGKEIPPKWARLVMAYNENGRIELESTGQSFPLQQLVPGGIPDRGKPYSIIVESFWQNRLGFVLFEVGPREGVIYELLREQISSVMSEVLLVQQAESRAKELEARNAELDAFAHTVAHDLKIPLSAMVGFSSAIEARFDEMPPEELRKGLHRITQAGLRMSGIINALLLLSSVRKEDVETEPLNMANIVNEAQNRLASLLTESQAEIIVPDEWPVAVGYTPWVEEVWANYISNAAKYGGHPGRGVPPRVELGFDERAPASGSHIRFWVHDNGPGLTPKEQAHLFAPFTRLHQVRSEGHGLGLSIVQRIVEKLGGETGVESNVGEGSLFYFTLPKAQPLMSVNPRQAQYESQHAPTQQSQLATAPPTEY
jgi:DNA-binding LacI/PurR family transcriptional regulator/signal transduction histidine kinase